MFKKFHWKEDVSGQTQVKSSVQRSIRAKLLDLYPQISQQLDEILPKKGNMVLIKCKDHVQMISIQDEILFFNSFDGPWYPTLRLLHQYPEVLPRVQVDRGAIKFVLSGANIMCPGLTSKGGRMEEVLASGRIVAVMAEGKEHALAIGQLTMSTDEIRSVNKGIGIETIHYLRDPLWENTIGQAGADDQEEGDNDDGEEE